MFTKWLPIIWGLRDRLSLVWVILQDKRVPTWQKAIPLLPLIYILSPLNLVSLPIPIIGQIDDAILFMMAFELMEQVIDEKILKEHKKQQKQQ